MRTLLLFVLCMTCSNIDIYAQTSPVVAADSVKTFLNKSFAILQANSINKDSVNWKTLRNQVNEKTKYAQTYEEVLTVFPYIFQQIGDHHAALKYKGKAYYWPMANAYTNEAVKQAVKTYNTVLVKKLSGNIGYLLLPGNNDFGAKRINEDALAIRKAIATIDNKNIKGWIIDLRVNTGGNMYQMLAGLGLLLGDGKAGGFVNQHNETQGEWIIKSGNIYIDTNKVSNMTGAPNNPKKYIPLAILISGQTASSGEVVAISTVGRKNAVLIGENSAGYTTGNQGFVINKDAGLNLAVDFDRDRKGKVYRSYLTPNIPIVGGDNFEDLKKDTKVIKAIAWIKNTAQL